MRTSNDSTIDYSASPDTPLSLATDAAPGRPHSRATRRVWECLDLRSGVVSATNFATTLIIARLCDKADVGVYYLAWTLLLFIVLRRQI